MGALLERTKPSMAGSISGLNTCNICSIERYSIGKSPKNIHSVLNNQSMSDAFKVRTSQYYVKHAMNRYFALGGKRRP